MKNFAGRRKKQQCGETSRRSTKRSVSHRRPVVPPVDMRAIREFTASRACAIMFLLKVSTSLSLLKSVLSFLGGNELPAQSNTLPHE